MKFKYMLLSVLASGFFLFSKQESFFKIDGMMCKNGCVYKVNSVVKSINGVEEVDVNYGRGILMVIYDSDKTNDDYIIEKLTSETTYTVKKENKKSVKKNLFRSILNRITNS